MPNKRIKHFTDSLYYDIEQSARLMKKASIQFFDILQIDITPDEYSALDTISCNAGICQRDLAILILKDRANTGRILDSLEEKQLITRFIDTKNNRLVKKLGITEKGYQKVKEITQKMESYLNKTTQDITSEELELLHKTLKKFRKHLEEVVKINI